EPRSVQRVSVLTEQGAKGRLDLYLVEAAGDSPVATGDLVPTVSMMLDGENPRSSIDFPAVQASTLAARWTPEDGSQPLEIRELNSFGDTEIATYAVNAAPQAIGEQ